MTTSGTQMQGTQTSETASRTTQAPLVAIVGFDGSPSSRQALLAAVQLINGREGRIETVFVAHVPSTAALSSDAEAAIRQGFDEVVRDLTGEARTLFGQDEQRWTFQRRDGGVAHELLDAAHGLRDELGPEATVVIVVGSSSHLYHQVLGSVPVSLAHQKEFPLLVVPAAADAG